MPSQDALAALAAENARLIGCWKPMALIGEHRLQLPHARRQPDDQACRLNTKV